MKKILTGLAALVIASPAGAQITRIIEPYKEGLTFNVEENVEYYLGHAQADVNDDGRMDAIAAGYSKDGNNYAEVKAFFRIRYIRGDGMVSTEENAYFVTVDVDEDGQVDYILLDRNRDGVLETVETPRVAMEEIKNGLWEKRN